MTRQRTSIFLAVLAVHVLAAAAMLQQQRAVPAAPVQTIEAFLIAETPRPVAAEAIPVSLQSPVFEMVTPEIQVVVNGPATPAPEALPVLPPSVPPMVIADSSPSQASLRVLTPADYLRTPAPRYPPLARQLRQQGVAVVRVTIAASGEPQQVEIERSSGYRQLDDAALEAVRRCWFRPLLEAGTARAIVALVPIEFVATARFASR